MKKIPLRVQKIVRTLNTTEAAVSEKFTTELENEALNLKARITEDDECNFSIGEEYDLIQNTEQKKLTETKDKKAEDGKEKEAKGSKNRGG